MGENSFASACPLCDAARTGNLTKIEQLLKAGTDPNQYEERLEKYYGEGDDYYEGTSLMWAAKKGHTEVVKILLENGADPILASK